MANADPKFTEDLVEGRYKCIGGSGSIGCNNYTVMREFYRQLSELRESEHEFAALEGAHQSGWIISAKSCADTYRDLVKYAKAFLATDPISDDINLYRNLTNVFHKVSEDGMIFCHHS